MFQKFNFDTEWAVKLISRITNDEDTPIEGDALLKQVMYMPLKICLLMSMYLYSKKSKYIRMMPL